MTAADTLTAFAAADDLTAAGDEAWIRIFDTRGEEVDTVLYTAEANEAKALQNIRVALANAGYPVTGPWTDPFVTGTDKADFRGIRATVAEQ